MAEWKDECFMWTPNSFHVFFDEKYVHSPFGSPPKWHKQPALG